MGVSWEVGPVVRSGSCTTRRQGRQFPEKNQKFNLSKTQQDNKTTREHINLKGAMTNLRRGRNGDITSVRPTKCPGVLASFVVPACVKQQQRFRVARVRPGTQLSRNHAAGNQPPRSRRPFGLPRLNNARKLKTHLVKKESGEIWRFG